LKLFRSEKLWDKAFVDSRPDVGWRFEGFAIDKKFYDDHRKKSLSTIAEHDDEVIDKYLNRSASDRGGDAQRRSVNRRWR